MINFFLQDSKRLFALAVIGMICQAASLTSNLTGLNPTLDLILFVLGFAGLLITLVIHNSVEWLRSHHTQTAINRLTGVSIVCIIASLVGSGGFAFIMYLLTIVFSIWWLALMNYLTFAYADKM